MDCFYASVEMREYPQHKGKPLAVGGSGGRGVLTTANYVARSYGVRSAMPVHTAKELCPQLICMPVRHSLYREESRKIRRILEESNAQVEMASIDEAYMRDERDGDEAFAFAAGLRARISKDLGLPASIGIGPNKMISKIVSGLCKPDNQKLVSPEEVQDFMSGLKLKLIPGIGPKAQRKLQDLGFQTCSDLQKLSPNELSSIFGVWGLELYDRVRGIDDRGLHESRERKSISAERTLLKAIDTEELLLASFEKLYKNFEKRLQLHWEKGSSSRRDQISSVYVRLKFQDFSRTSKEKRSSVLRLEEVKELARSAFDRSNKPVRLIGIGARFKRPLKKRGNPRQLKLF